MPKVERNNYVPVRLSEVELERLQAIMNKLDKNQSDAVRYAIRFTFNDLII